MGIKRISLLVFLACGFCLGFGGFTSAAGDTVESKYGLRFDVPGPEWTVKTYEIAPVLAGLTRVKSDAVITITCFDFSIYDEIDIDYGYLKRLLEKNEKSTYKPVKHNYERVALDKVTLSTGEAARLEFTTQNGGEKRRSVVTCFNSDKVVFFVSMEAREEEYNNVVNSYKSLLSSISVE